jgi:hypothetical protein
MAIETMSELSLDDLAHVSGGLSWDTVKGGIRTVYREAVKDVTAVGGGWKLANAMYGTNEHGASWSEKVRAMRAFKGYLDGGDKLPSWAPNW